MSQSERPPHVGMRDGFPGCLMALPVADDLTDFLLWCLALLALAFADGLLLALLAWRAASAAV